MVGACHLAIDEFFFSPLFVEYHRNIIESYNSFYFTFIKLVISLAREGLKMCHLPMTDTNYRINSTVKL